MKHEHTRTSQVKCVVVKKSIKMSFFSSLQQYVTSGVAGLGLNPRRFSLHRQESSEATTPAASGSGMVPSPLMMMDPSKMNNTGGILMGPPPPGSGGSIGSAGGGGGGGSPGNYGMGSGGGGAASGATLGELLMRTKKNRAKTGNVDYLSSLHGSF